MKKRIYLITTWVSFLMLISCQFNSNNLKQENAENTIKDYISSFSIDNPEIAAQQNSFNAADITAIDKVNIYTQFRSSVDAHFNYKDTGSEKNLVLKFLFERTPDNQWFLISIESVEGVTSEHMKTWLERNKNLRIPVQ